MSANTQSNNQQAARLTGRRRSSTLRTALDQLQSSGRRRSSTVRRYARNVENFNRNLAAGAARRRSSVATPLPRTMRTRSMVRVEDEESTTAHQQSEEAPVEWQPSIVIGSPLWLENEDPSTIQIADRKVAQTRLWAEHYRRVPRFTELLEEAERERVQLDENDQANTKPRSTLATVHSKAINQRVDILQNILQHCQFDPERRNIEAAISGYESGSIHFSDSYTVIWAGRIVDRMPDYESFSNTREALLDRYVSEYGPGWLWYEPPLKGNTTITAKRGTSLVNTYTSRRQSENMGHYQICLGFQRRKELVARGGGLYSAMPSPYHTSTASRKPSEPDTLGPIVYYETLLDSGATLPCIWANDLLCIGINPKTYSAQTVKTVNTADGSVQTRCYEMTVFLYPFPEHTTTTTTTSTKSSHAPQRHLPTHNPPSYPSPPVGPPTWPSEPPIISVLVPVVVFAGSSAADFDPSATPDRLSGFAPFIALYISSTPGQFQLNLGEDRRDVLGASRMPGQIRYRGEGNKTSKKTSQLNPGHPAWLSNKQINETPRRITFEHEFVDGTGRILRDEDGDDEQGVGGRSILVVGSKGTTFDQLDPRGGVAGQSVTVVEPRKGVSQRKALQEWEERDNKAGGGGDGGGSKNVAATTTGKGKGKTTNPDSGDD
ncbi:hypothetical protein QBC43DRAFT_370185 [Cladorrhinum sp. PSN259]|nr:hypothetical protein QBC43DRAFT_370185 [Cladorrhinum sp. PSN259]